MKEPKEKSPTTVKDVKDIIFMGSKNIMSKVMSSPSKDKIQNKKPDDKKVEVKKTPIMTRRQLTDPFGSDDEEEIDNKIVNNKVPEINGDLNGSSVHRKENSSDEFSDLPKPNAVSF